MAKKKSDISKETPCGGKGEIVTAEQVIGVIKTKRFNSEEVRTCFWYFTTGLGNKSLDHPDCKKVLGVMKKIRPRAHDKILETIANALLAKKKK